MRPIPILCIASAALMFSGIARADCAPEQLVGTWECRGTVCTPGHLKSTLTLANGSLTWKDGLDNDASVNLDHQQITVFFASGAVFTGTLDSACARITWDSRGEHTDYKI